MRQKQPAVHITELKSFLRCRLAWFLSAPPPRGLGLEPVVAKAALQQGRVIHKALQIGYDTGVPFAEAYVGLATEAVEGSKEGTIFQSELDSMRAQTGQGEAMLQGYQEWAALRDTNYQFLSMEQKWDSVKIGGIPFAGTFDAIVQRDDGLWILDFKTSKYRTTDWTEQDLQATMYIHAARRLIGREIRGIIFRFLLKKIPATYDKLILKNGSVTTKKGLPASTTYREYLLAQAVATLQFMIKKETIVFPGPPLSLGSLAGIVQSKQSQEAEWWPLYEQEFLKTRRLYYSKTQELKGVDTFFWEVEEFRTETQINNYLQYVIYPAAKEMRSRRKGRWIGPTGLGASFTVCNGCKFKTPCEMFMRGAPGYRELLCNEYQLRDIYRKEVKGADSNASSS